jgi:hypothetical protein
MEQHVKYVGGGYFVCNPEDNGENFAEKWNRPLEGHKYRKAFCDWYLDAGAAVSLGLESFASADDFTKAINESFGIGASFITAINNEIPANWTLPGRPEGITRNTLSMGALFGGTSAAGSSQAKVKPVERLG